MLLGVIDPIEVKSDWSLEFSSGYSAKFSTFSHFIFPHFIASHWGQVNAVENAIAQLYF